MAYFSLEPFGDDLLDQQMASLQALTANINTDPKKGRRYRPGDFSLRNRVPKDDDELSPGQIFQRFKANLGLAKGKK